jgi:hypothetical protein
LLQRIILTTALFSAFSMSNAELADLTESELSDVSGEGIALVFENFQIEMKGDVIGGEVGNDFQITGIQSPTGDAVNVGIAQYYLSGTGSQLGTSLDGKLVNLGRLNNPITIDLLDGNSLSGGAGSWADKSVLAIAMPTQVANGYDCTAASSNVGSGTCSSRPDDADSNGFHGERFDMGYRINRIFDADINSVKNVNLNFHAQSANMDGSYVRLWGSEATEANQAMKMEVQMNFYASKLVFDSCDISGTNCGQQVGFEGFSMELALGDAQYFQPMTLDVTDTGFLHISILALPTPGNSRVPQSTDGSIAADGLAAGSDTNSWNWYNDYYTNGRKTNISISNLTVGAESFGSSSLQGLQIQYLDITSHEI